MHSNSNVMVFNNMQYMQYFTFGWAMGEIEDELVIERYNASLDALDLESQLKIFATTNSLNDAYIDRVHYERSSGELKLLLLTGDLQVGYWHTELSYTHAQIENDGVLRHALMRREEPCEIWYDEFVPSSDRWAHNFLLAPDDLRNAKVMEFRIVFEQFSYTQIAAERRKLTTPNDISEWR
jgi:hypothetical protein